MWYSRTLRTGLCPIPFRVEEASLGGAASYPLNNNPSITVEHSLLHLPATINNKKMKLMVDTGANRSFISIQVLTRQENYRIDKSRSKRVLLADGRTSFYNYGELELTIKLGGLTTNIRALVVEDLCADCIVGMDYITKYKLIIDMAKSTISINVELNRIELGLQLNGNEHRTERQHGEATTDASTDLQTVSINSTMGGKTSLDPHIASLISHINDLDQRQKFEEVLHKNSKLFDTSKPSIVSMVKPHEVKTLDHPPPSSKAYASNPSKQMAMRRIIDDLLKFGLARPSYSPYAAPALLVGKKDGTWRMVVDYKKLNNITIKDNYPLPNMEQALQTLGGGYGFFSKLDLKSGFWQIPVKEEDRHKTAFVTEGGLYEWNVLAQGLKNSPPSFQRVMAEVLAPCRAFSLIYIDDIIIFSRSINEHVQHLSQVLSLLSRHNFQVNPPKCNICHERIEYLSHVITRDSVMPSQDKIRAIMQLREPRKLTEANKFIGGLSWYRKYLPRFATIAAPILAVSNLTKPNRKKFLWSNDQHEAFLQLKQLLVTQPLLLDFPNDDHPLILTTDASKVGIGGTLQQIINGETKNIYYHSQVLTSAQRKYDPIELEALAIWLCFQRMRSYLMGRNIIIYTDHCPLCNMMNKAVRNRRVDRISMLLQEYNIENIIHIKGKQNCLADYLSRNPIMRDEEEIFNEDYGIGHLFEREPPRSANAPVINAVLTRSKRKELEKKENPYKNRSASHSNEEPEQIGQSVNESSEKSSLFSSRKDHFDAKQIGHEQSKDPIIQRTIDEVRKNPANPTFVLHDDLLYRLIRQHHRSRTNHKALYLPSSMIRPLIQAYHCDPTSGHFAFQRTYSKVKSRYWWPKMKESIAQFIKSCVLCQQFNVSRTRKPGHLCPIEPPDGPFQLIGVDYCGPFKRTPRDNQYVLCITDYYTRWITAIATADCSAQTTARVLFEEHVCRYGPPIKILSDKGTPFHNQLMESMSQLMGYNHIFSTAYHPQSNGMVERFNATFVPQLAKLQDRENNNWDEFLAAIVFAYNTGTHAATGYSPFQLQFGREPRLPPDKPPTEFVFSTPNDYYKQLQKSLGLIHQNARNRMKNQQRKYKDRYDFHRPDPKYEINDRVLIRIHGRRSKLDPRFLLDIHTIVRKDHPNYWVQDDTTHKVQCVHVNDVRPISF